MMVIRAEQQHRHWQREHCFTKLGPLLQRRLDMPLQQVAIEEDHEIAAQPPPRNAGKKPKRPLLTRLAQLPRRDKGQLSNDVPTPDRRDEAHQLTPAHEVNKVRVIAAHPRKQEKARYARRRRAGPVGIKIFGHIHCRQLVWFVPIRGDLAQFTDASAAAGPWR